LGDFADAGFHGRSRWELGDRFERRCFGLGPFFIGYGFITKPLRGKTYGNVFGGSVCGGDEYNLKNWKKRAKMGVCEGGFLPQRTQRTQRGAGNWGDDWGNLFFFDMAGFQPYHLASLKKLEKEGENEGL
jgi:hypothetical protein